MTYRTTAKATRHMASAKNVLFLMFDQLRWDYLSCYGHPHLKTPNIDKLAARGVQFDRAYIQAPICGASRMSTYTGRYANSHGATWNRIPLKVGEPTMGDHLRKAGMECWLVGKTHMQADTEGLERLGISPDSVIGSRIAECGFDVFERDLVWHSDDGLEAIVRESTFNVVSLFSGTGYGSAEVGAWGDFPLLVFIVAGFIGSCTASTGCSIKVFRFLVLFEAIKAQLRQLVSPNRVIPLHLDRRRLDDDVVVSVVVMFSAFVLGFGILTILLSLTGLEMRTAFTAAWTSICNIGPAFGPEVGATGAMNQFPVEAKWLMIAAMLLGRLEMVAVVVILLPRFWRG